MHWNITETSHESGSPVKILENKVYFTLQKGKLSKMDINVIRLLNNKKMKPTIKTQ